MENKRSTINPLYLDRDPVGPLLRDAICKNRPIFGPLGAPNKRGTISRQCIWVEEDLPLIDIVFLLV